MKMRKDVSHHNKISVFKNILFQFSSNKRVYFMGLVLSKKPFRHAFIYFSSLGDCRIDYSDSKWLADTLVWLAWSSAEL